MERADIEKKVEMIAGKLERAEANYHENVSKSLQRSGKDGT